MTQPIIEQRHLDLLESLSNAAGVSGNEEEVRKLVLKQVRQKGYQVVTDALGSVLLLPKHRDETKPLVMLDAHMDEVGFMLVSDDGDGLYSFELVGGIDPRSLPGKQVFVGKDHIPGVIGAKPIHLSTSEERSNKLSVESLRIDIGNAKGGKPAAGDRAVFATKLSYNKGNIFAKAIDDRIGVAILIQLLEHEFQNNQLAFSFSVQEEIGLRGAKVAAQRINPDIAIAIDATPANDHPAPEGAENTYYNTKLGQGPAIYTYDGSTLNDPRLVKHFLETAKANNIQAQLRQPGGGGTNAGSMHRANAGVPSISISVPHRYTHTSISISRISDWQATVQLLFAALQSISFETIKSPRP